jgi:siroheme synthase (precorrin-2 oxidase/ferrochelatase)
MLELKLQKEKDKEIISRKIAEIDEEINKISSANPLNAFFFAFVSAEGNSENEAIARAYERAKSFCNAAQAILGANTRIICDEEINRAIDVVIFPSGLDEYKNL